MNISDLWRYELRKGNTDHPQRASVRELIVSPRREYGRKPDQSYIDIERLVAGPYCDLFGRQQRTGWTVWGNEASKFGEMV